MTSDFFEKYMKCETAAAADPSQIITRGDVRFSVLTDRLLRVELDEDAHFTDEPTQSVWFRNFDKPVFETSESGNLIEIRTESTIYVYDLKVHKMHTVKLADGRVITDFHKGNLRGTARTLDNTYGKKKLEEQQDITVRFYEHVIDRFGREKARELDRLMLELESVLRDELNLMNNQEKGGEADE